MFTIHLNTKSKTPLYDQIYTYIKDEIRSGSIPYQAKLPSTRSLATYLQVSRNTVDMAYSQLVSEGYIESKSKSGYYVCQIAEMLTLPESCHLYQSDAADEQRGVDVGGWGIIKKKKGSFYNESSCQS